MRSYWNARNNALNDFKKNDKYTHLLLLSDKISADPRTIINLINSKHSVSGLVAPMGMIRWINLVQNKVRVTRDVIMKEPYMRYKIMTGRDKKKSIP